VNIQQCSKPNAKEKFQQLSIAYTKLISNNGRRRDVDFENEDGCVVGDDSPEMQAFMKMFMDLVGIFNEGPSVPIDLKMPGAGKEQQQQLDRC
jgi:cytochrome c